MRTLFDMDTKDYDPSGKRFVRPSARGIVRRDGKIAMIYVRRFNCYKFPGGGIDPGEDRIHALIREVREEAGLVVIPESVTEYGLVHRVEFHKEYGDIFDQENYYYFCEAEPKPIEQKLEDYEKADGFKLEFVSAEKAAAVNSLAHGSEEVSYELTREIERERRVLELLIQEGYA